MAGLIFLWQGIPAVLVNTDSGLKPDILIDVLEPILFVDSTDAVFTNSTVTVNDSVITVNDGTALVSGSDIISTDIDIYGIFDNAIPTLLVDDSSASFADSTVTVNDSVITVNDGTALVGGRDTFSWKVSFSARIEDIKPIFFKVGDL